VTFAKVAFENRSSGARLEGEFIADTGPTWLVKPTNKPVQVLQKTEWDSVPISLLGSLENLFGSEYLRG
jgi:hypothetical protein